ncbi:MAG: hypothetical protein Q8S24_01030 [Eubacteriales bacterium]|nr:hypothetical protein [Eubacteriales bacterium]
MILNNSYEKLRNHYKPDNVEVLFVGESRPQGGTFFYQGDSALYRETKKAFDEFFREDVFTLNRFKNWNCWLYDICEDPVNGLGNHERKKEIHFNMPRLVDIIETLNAKAIIVCKKTFVESEIRNSRIMDNYCEGESIFFLPFPGQGNQIKFREGLVKSLGEISFCLN